MGDDEFGRPQESVSRAGRMPVPPLDAGENMTATYTFDVFSSLDGFGAASGDALDGDIQQLVHRATRHG
jgi:hypothetical protein